MSGDKGLGTDLPGQVRGPGCPAQESGSVRKELGIYTCLLKTNRPKGDKEQGGTANKMELAVWRDRLN